MTINLYTLVIILTISVSVKIDAAFPGGRDAPAAWYLNGKLWLFGGFGSDNSTYDAFLNDIWTFDTTSLRWSFVGGSMKGGQNLSYVAVGEYNEANTPGGLANMCPWVSDGLLYLFGGKSRTSDQYSNAVWRYDPSANRWAVRQTNTEGPASYYSSPYQISARTYAQCVVRSSSLVYIAGGRGYAGSTALGFLNDIWGYNVADNAWEFISGEPTNLPLGNITTPDVPFTNRFTSGSLFATGSWDSTNNVVYLSTGFSNVDSVISRVYRFNPVTTPEWTLLGNYTTIDLTPRVFVGSVSDGEGKAWIFGGVDSMESGGYYADLLEWNGTSWRHLAGPRTTNANGSYPLEANTTSSTIYPGPRQSPAMWLDDSNQIWLFGGYGLSRSTLLVGVLSDLWRYSLTTNMWTFVAGSSDINILGNFTADFIATPAPVPVAPAGPIAQPSPIDSPTASPVGTGPESQPAPNAAVVPSPGDPLKQEAKIAIGVVIPAVVIGVGLLVLLLMLKKRKQKKKTSPTKTTQMEDLIPDDSNSHYRVITVPDNLFGSYGSVTSAQPPSSKVTTKSFITNSSDNRFIPYSSITLEKEIGEGSFGKVYLGKYRTTKVAVKVANTNLAQDEFIREANFQLAIPPHPNIVQLLGISIDGPKPLVVLEYCNEGSLDKQLFGSNKVNTPAEQIALAEAIARGIDHLHQNAIVHRDLAVRNILLHRGEPKISDFGMSRKLKEVSQVGKTATNIGPLRWMAPEALGKQQYSTKSDVWSFGMILYEIVAHQEPHEHDDLISIAIKIRDDGYTPKIPDSCPPLLHEIMLMCWKMDPDARPEMSTICAMLEGK